MDLLKPRTVPLSEETILWFEFLLKPSLLTKHLTKVNPDPSATDLITQFLTIAPESQNQTDVSTPDPDGGPNKAEGLKYSKKQLALKILALKVAAFIRWDLDKLERSLTVARQVQLLGDLCSITAGKMVTLPLSLVHESPAVGPDGSKHSLTFALTLYHRWVLRAQVIRAAVIKNTKPFNTHGPTMPDPAAFTLRDESSISALEPFTQLSIDFLNQLAQDPHAFRVLTYDSFVPLDSNTENTQQRFDSAIAIKPCELRAQIHYDLCQYYLYVQRYELARQNVLLCKENYAQWQREEIGRTGLPPAYCTVDTEGLKGYLLACGVTGEPDGLLQRLHESILNHYSDIVMILKEDNIRKEIPMTQRKLLELNIEGYNAIGSTDGNPIEQMELELAVAALNIIRYVMDGENILSCNVALQKYKNQLPKLIESLFQYADEQYEQFSLAEQEHLKRYFFKIISLYGEEQGAAIEGFVQTYSKVVSVQELKDFRLQRPSSDIQLSGIAVQSDWIIPESKNPRLELGQLERQLISCTSANAIRKLLVKIAGTNPSKPLFTINPSWSIPYALEQILIPLPRGFLQDFAYILIGKARELTARKDYPTAITLLTVLKNETQRPELVGNPLVAKLGKMVSWEGLLVQVQQVLDEWPKKPADLPQLIRNCKQCLNASVVSNSGAGDLVPHAKVLEHCAALLLNFNEWNSLLIQPDKRFPGVELCSALTQAFLDIEKFKGTKKTNREAWELVLPMFISQPGSRQRQLAPDSPLVLLIAKLRDPLVISIMLSLLAKLHNILKDETNLDMNAEYMFLWPTNVNNTSIYSIKLVSEALNLLLNQALKYYPNNIPWLKLKGDLEFVANNHEAAMRFYVTALISGTEYCTVHLQRPLFDDFLIRRMVRCSSALGCFVQAAVLCQFFDETDYGLAFKSISERSANFADAMDTYYSCIWDPTLLEFIVNWHYKRGEHKRRLQTISFLGQLELNANNNEEIKREAAAVRKNRFLRSLAKQYMC
ncbi:integrator complex subunit 8 [Anopheles ziemanni]|uniref:integrator complex subunit 8 n=1 Tax=Anopheles coustani TaxID=139045 RepID=UPI00265B179E|nr:integrator complex subunit 8 [Anopheles coustani]XP_058174799.1 integrator complex subunit 8 [Anopheles ziemanni]